jgi:Outer membrane protein beta-barrel domain
VSSLYTRGAAFGNDTPPGIQKSDWKGFFGGIEYNQRIANSVEFGVSIDGYSRGLDTSYRDYVRPDDSPIQQRLKLSVVPIGASLRLGPTGRHASIAPFVVVGVDAMVYRYEEYGDFVDFSASGQPIVADSFVDEGVAFGVHAGGGLRVALGDDFSIVGEARYFWSKKDMNQDFASNRIDLGGLAATIGFHLRF